MFNGDMADWLTGSAYEMPDEWPDDEYDDEYIRPVKAQKKSSLKPPPKTRYDSMSIDDIAWTLGLKD